MSNNELNIKKIWNKRVNFMVSKYPYCCFQRDDEQTLSSSKSKTRKRFTVIIFLIAFRFGTLKSEPASAVTLSFPVQRNVKDLVQKSPYQKIKSAPFIRQNSDRIKFDFIASREAFPLIYINSKIYLTEDLIKKIRPGSDNIIVDIIMMCALVYAITNAPVADAFIGEVLKQISNLNAPTVKPHQYFDQSWSQQSSSQIHRSPSCGESENDLTDRELGRVNYSQSKTFDGDIEQGYQEILRRAEGSPNFNCSKKRFVSLCTENGNMGPKKMQEAITVLQLETDSEVINVRRDPIAEQNGVLGVDFIAEDKNGDTIYIEIKGPVGSAIKLAEGDDPSVAAHGESIGRESPRMKIN